MSENKDNRTIFERLHAVMVEVPAVQKKDRNEHQRFNFRGIDAVVNAVGPALRNHGVVMLPEVQSCEYTVEQFGSNRTSMGHVQVLVKYTFIGLSGDSVSVISAGEATDSGDKATAKAMSVALRTALLQTLCLPTDEPDPDHYTYERSEVQEVVEPKKAAPKAAAKKTPAKPSAVYARFTLAIAESTDAEKLNEVRSAIAEGAKDLAEDELASLRDLFAEKKASLE